MKQIVLGLVWLFYVFSCSNKEKNITAIKNIENKQGINIHNSIDIKGKNIVKKEEIKNKQVINLYDSVYIYFYNGFIKSFSLNYRLNKDSIRIVNNYVENKRIFITDKYTINQLIKKIEPLYVKKEKIVLSIDSIPVPVTDYPFLSVILFKEGNKVIEKDIILYSNMEFNPKFLDFYNFLDNLPYPN